MAHRAVGVSSSGLEYAAMASGRSVPGSRAPARGMNGGLERIDCGRLPRGSVERSLVLAGLRTPRRGPIPRRRDPWPSVSTGRGSPREEQPVVVVLEFETVVQLAEDLAQSARSGRRGSRR